MTGKGRIGRNLEGKCRKFILIPLGYVLVETKEKEKKILCIIENASSEVQTEYFSLNI